MAHRYISKARAAGESALRTFLQAAIPAAVASWQLSGHEFDKTAGATVLVAGVSAGLAAVMRVAKPIQTDSPGVSVTDVTAGGRPV